MNSRKLMVIFWAGAALVGMGMGTAQASSWVDERTSAYGERHELLADPGLAGNTVFNDERLSAYGERNEIEDLTQTHATFAGSEDLNAILPPTAAGEGDVNEQLR